MDQEKLQFEMRLAAMENMIAQACIMCARIAADEAGISEAAAVDILSQSARAAAARVTFPELGAARSDLVASELAAAMDRLLDMVQGQQHPQT